MNARIHKIEAQPPSFQPPLDQLTEKTKEGRIKLVFICNPNNPTGIYLEQTKIQHLINACSENTLLVLDEAYRSFVDGQFFSPPPLVENCLVLRSMTQDFALAGLRIGYALANSAVIRQLAAFQPTWSVNAMAQAAGLAAISEITYYQTIIKKLGELRKRFFRRLSNYGFSPVNSDVHFGIIPTHRPASEIRYRLLKYFLLVRDCASFGLPYHIRVCTQKENANLRLLKVLREIQNE